MPTALTTGAAPIPTTTARRKKSRARGAVPGGGVPTLAGGYGRLVIDGDDEGRAHPGFVAVLNDLVPDGGYAALSSSESGAHILVVGRFPAGTKQVKIPLERDVKGFSTDHLDDDEEAHIDIFDGKHLTKETGKRVVGAPAEVGEVDAEALAEYAEEYDGSLPSERGGGEGTNTASSADGVAEPTAGEYAGPDPETWTVGDDETLAYRASVEAHYEGFAHVNFWKVTSAAASHGAALGKFADDVLENLRGEDRDGASVGFGGKTESPGGEEYSTRRDVPNPPVYRKRRFADGDGRGRAVPTKAYSGLVGKLFERSREKELVQALHRIRPLLAEPALSVGRDLLDRAVGDDDGRLGVLARIEELLERRAAPGEATDFPAHDVIVRPGLDGVEELAERLAGVVGPGLSEVDVAIDIRAVGVHVDPLVDTLLLMPVLLLVRAGLNVGGNSGHVSMAAVAPS